MTKEERLREKYQKLLAENASRVDPVDRPSVIVVHADRLARALAGKPSAVIEPKIPQGLRADLRRALLSRQGNVCPICKRDFAAIADLREPCIDHCHKTFVVRGILCQNCNTGLGHFQDDPDRLRNAIEYLSKPR